MSRWPATGPTLPSSFNPLHCGAVVASGPRSAQVSGRRSSFNPLHCGAVVASRQIGRSRWRRIAFNPLHCGAVVASAERGARIRRRRRAFNPLHCGAVVASRRSHRPRSVRSCAFQSPSLRGSGRFEEQARREAEARAVLSIPFIAGQWSLRGDRAAQRARKSPFQSPSLRGSGRFRGADWFSRLVSNFQSPSLRGSGRFRRAAAGPPDSAKTSFNPLHCGAVVASPSHNALPSLRRPAAEFATCLRPPSLGVLAQVA